jgi:uncharacterized YccA/Bax inhibitor family protein
MPLFKSGNPTLQEDKFNKTLDLSQADGVMTERGTMNKFFLLSLLLIAAASFTWNAYYQGVDTQSWMIGSAIGGFVLALIISFKPRWAPTLAPFYGLLEGVFVGSISAFFNQAFAEKAPGIVMQAVGLTFGVVIAMYVLYRFQIIKATERFRSIVFMATAGIAVFYLLTWVLRLFGVEMSFLHEGSLLGIGLSLVIVTIAALNLILDFDMIEKGVEMGAPKFMEWYSAFGLMVTVVWLYLEMLRLLAKLNSRD